MYACDLSHRTAAHCFVGNLIITQCVFFAIGFARAPVGISCLSLYVRPIHSLAVCVRTYLELVVVS